MILLKLYYRSLDDDLEDFLMLLERLISCYKSDLLKEKADRLFDLVSRTVRV